VDSRRAIKAGIVSGQKVVDAYLADLTDAEILVRPVPGTNHIAWQLGHLISAEHDMMEAVRPKSMPELPSGFREKHKKETATSDDPKAFFTKAQYVEAVNKQRAGTLALLETMSDAELDQPAPEALKSFLKTVGEAFTMQGTHWVMHAGQWAVVRRKLGRPPLF
jgi:DinB family protein